MKRSGLWRALLCLRKSSTIIREWSNVYKTVDVTLSTHAAGGLELDVTLAEAMDKLAG